MSEKKMDWKDTLNLPRTDFPMKAQLSLKEPETLKKWEAAAIYEKILDDHAKQEPYILHDGPPYANGNIHLGTALNKILKDFVVKSKSMEGFRSPYVPGWDCHGLPIEHKVDQKLGSRKKSMSQLQVREECRQYAEKFLDLQRADFKRLGIFGAWDQPYTTLDPSYEATVIRFFNSFVRKGNVYRKKRPVYWCLSDRTALAEAEVEYHDHTSPSITVKFPLRQLPPFLNEYAGRAVSVLIWTTTPWTIPANLAIAAHPDFDYALFEMKGELYIAASALLPAIAALNGDPFAKLKEFKGRELDGLKARHPLYDRDSLLINTNYVLLDQGTGWCTPLPATARTTTTPAWPTAWTSIRRSTPTAASMKRPGPTRGCRYSRPTSASSRTCAKTAACCTRAPSPTPTPTAGAARTRSSTGPRPSGSSPWTRPTCAPTPWRPSRECSGSPPGARSAFPA